MYVMCRIYHLSISPRGKCNICHMYLVPYSLCKLCHISSMPRHTSYLVLRIFSSQWNFLVFLILFIPSLPQFPYFSNINYREAETKPGDNLMRHISIFVSNEQTYGQTGRPTLTKTCVTAQNVKGDLKTDSFHKFH